MRTLNVRAIFRLAVSRGLEFWREPVAVFWVFGFPLTILIVLGWTFTDAPPQTLHVDWVASAESPLPKRVRKRLTADPRLILQRSTLETARRRLAEVSTSVVIRVHAPPEPEAGPQFTLLYDPVRPDSELARAVVEMHIARSGGSSPAVSLVKFRSAGRRYVDFLVPGLLAVGAMGASLVWFGYGLVQWRASGLLRALLATPLNRTELFAGLLLARLLLLIPETLIVLATSWWLFGVTVTGSPWALAAAQAIGATAFAGIGLLIGAEARRLETASGWVSVLMLVQWVFCGVFFARSVFPDSWQPAIGVLPLSPYVEAVRGIMLDGGGGNELMGPLAVLTLWATAGTAVGMLRFRVD